MLQTQEPPSRTPAVPSKLHPLQGSESEEDDAAAAVVRSSNFVYAAPWFHWLFASAQETVKEVLVLLSSVTADAGPGTVALAVTEEDRSDHSLQPAAWHVTPPSLHTRIFTLYSTPGVSPANACVQGPLPAGAATQKLLGFTFSQLSSLSVVSSAHGICESTKNSYAVIARPLL